MVERDRIAEFKEVAEIMPDDPVVRFGLAGAYLEAGQAESAVLEYEETIRLKPDYSAAHRGLGRALERAGRREDAQAAYRKGLEVATRTGDLQTKKEIEGFLRRLDSVGGWGAGGGTASPPTGGTAACPGAAPAWRPPAAG